ncbi:GGDEF domain-containing protein [Vibrio intestinalis]|uniref:GGDEF domain-containing protein n=1 Tax=Vibrio intestinalis TaxID=2933291 RepID=UPI0021A61170|nr:GGDEF domain-containing protein [Vibrio intestinalis]
MKSFHKLVFVMTIFSVTAVWLHWLYGDTKVYKISPNQFVYVATNDQVQKGASTSSLTQTPHKTVLDCQLQTSEDYAWPYCGLSIHIQPENAAIGIDLSDYHTIRLDLDFERLDSDEKPTMRFYLRNFNPAYSKTDDEYTHKYNGLDYRLGDYSKPLEIPLKSLQVLTWWLVDNKIPIEHSSPEFNNINRIEFATGSGSPVGQYQMTVNSIEFIGEYIAGEDLMMGLLIMWIVTGMTYSAHEIRNSRKLIADTEHRRQKLKTLNRNLREQNVQFAEMAHHDPLTGAMNRHSIREWLDKEFVATDGGNLQLSVIYVDIDHFKQVNDQFGHKMGDDILREFTMVILGQLRVTDRLVRWGGEEFVIFSPFTTLDQAVIVAERLRKKIAQHIWIHGEVLTASLGVADLGDESPTDMLARADEVLYLAKRNGRNRVEVAERVQ